MTVTTDALIVIAILGLVIGWAARIYPML